MKASADVLSRGYSFSMRLCHPPEAVPIPSISCCVSNHHNLFYQIQNALAFNRDTCCHLVLCLQLLPFHFMFILFSVIFSIFFPTDLAYYIYSKVTEKMRQVLSRSWNVFTAINFLHKLQISMISQSVSLQQVQMVCQRQTL